CAHRNRSRRIAAPTHALFDNDSSKTSDCARDLPHSDYIAGFRASASRLLVPRRSYCTISTILNSIVPRGAFTLIVSPTCALSRASPMGLLTETLVTSLLGSA